MNPPVNKTIFFEAGAVLFLTIGIFVLDVLVPRGWDSWLLYFLPLALSLQSPRERDPYYFAAVVMPLTIVGGYLSPPGGIDFAADMVNRCMGITVMWTFTWLMVRQKKAQGQLEGAETARSLAETQREAAVAARDLAEASATGAIHRESQTARELLMSSLRLESILHSAMDAIVTIDDQQRVLLFNEAAEHMFKCSAKDAIGQSVDKFVPSRFREAHRHHIQGFGKSGVTSRKMGQLGTIMGLRGDGEEFPLEAAISHITIDGKTFYTVILRDITERKEAERLMRQSEERYRRLISVTPVAMFVTRDGRIIFVNDAGLRLFGAVRADEILGKSPFDLFHADYHAMIRERIHQLMEGNATVPLVDERVVTLDGTIIDAEVSSARFVDEEGPAVLVMLRDISDRKRLQEQLRKTERIAELGTLASGMAHEIGTPMNVILGRAEYLMDRVKDEAIKKGLQTIVVQVERITRVMNQLLAFARRKPPDRGPLALKGVIENSTEMFQERLARSRVRVEVNVEEPCPNVLADSDQMSQVMINLIMNALHAMPDGGTLRIEQAPAKDRVRLTVTDTGHGIPQEAIQKIFEPFFTTKEFGKGTGLGLTVVKGIIEEHQGSIAVESAPGGGTTFIILLPAAPAG
jgi:PAS domain S-box-containing protein